MEIKQQVPKIETCKKLKELGYVQEGLFWWNDWRPAGGVTVVPWTDDLARQDDDFNEKIESYVAPTVSELLEILPKNLVQIAIYDGRLMLFTEDFDVEDEPNAAEAMALMLIYLAENDYIDFKKNVDS